jgi:chromosome segregation ATPase
MSALESAIAQTLSARVEEAIRKVLGSDVDELDGPTFDAVAFTNRAFADDRALEGLDKAIAGYDAEVRALDESILETVREQSSAGALAARDIADAKDSIGDLHSKIVEIKKKAEASEQMVQDICKDIKQLDVAKRHLTNAILTLARLKTLTEAVAQLQEHTAAKSYDEAAPVLEVLAVVGCTWRC